MCKKHFLQNYIITLQYSRWQGHMFFIFCSHTRLADLSPDGARMYFLYNFLWYFVSFFVLSKYLNRKSHFGHFDILAILAILWHFAILAILWYWQFGLSWHFAHFSHIMTSCPFWHFAHYDNLSMYQFELINIFDIFALFTINATYTYTFLRIYSFAKLPHSKKVKMNWNGFDTQKLVKMLIIMFGGFLPPKIALIFCGMWKCSNGQIWHPSTTQ